jgi:uncharacterized protein (DUF58 family)
MDTPIAPVAPVPMNRKTRYYYAHKDEAEFKNRLRDAKRKYYEANKDRLIQKALDRYYAQKQLREAQGQPEPTA